jgi:hypothetical protein
MYDYELEQILGLHSRAEKLMRQLCKCTMKLCSNISDEPAISSDLRFRTGVRDVEGTKPAVVILRRVKI